MDGKRREYNRKEWIRMDGTGMDGKGIDGKGLDGKEMEGNALKGNGLDGNGMERKRKEWKKITSLQSEVMGICTLMPHLLGGFHEMVEIQGGDSGTLHNILDHNVKGFEKP
jgi:hypothetical protein